MPIYKKSCCFTYFAQFTWNLTGIFLKVGQERKWEIQQSNQIAINTTATTSRSNGWTTIVKVISVPPANNEGIIEAHDTQMGNLWESVSLVTLPFTCFYISSAPFPVLVSFSWLWISWKSFSVTTFHHHSDTCVVASSAVHCLTVWAVILPFSICCRVCVRNSI